MDPTLLNTEEIRSKQPAFVASNESKYFSLMEYAPLACFHLNAEGNLLTVNNKAAELTGYTKRELLEMKLASLLVKGHLNISDSLSGGVPALNAETDIIRKSGEILPVEVNSTLLPDGSIQCLMSDISGRRQADLALRESEARLRELNATKDKFFSIIAHDLRSPFYTIMGFCSVLSEQVKAKEYEGVDEFSEIILKTSQKAMDLLKNLLEWAISQTGRMIFNPENLDLFLLIHESIDVHRDAARQKSIAITPDVPRELFLLADRSMISSVIRNLISNAIKFSRVNGNIVISAGIINGDIQVSVRDNGVGMSQKEIQRLFRIDEAHATIGTRKEEGTGLGLILCKEFVDKHKGKIWVESEPEIGSTFYFTVPGTTF